MREDPPDPAKDRIAEPGPTPSKPPPSPSDEVYDHLRRQRQARVAKAIVFLVVLGLLIAFISANAHAVPVSYVFFTRHPPLIWVMLACAVLGGIVGYLIGRPGKQLHLRRGKDDEDDRKRGRD
jgi:uncharacterized integral membrane protein